MLNPPLPITIDVPGAYGAIPGELRSASRNRIVFATGIAIPVATPVTIRATGAPSSALRITVDQSWPGAMGERLHAARGPEAVAWYRRMVDAIDTEATTEQDPHPARPKPGETRSTDAPSMRGVEIEIVDDSDDISGIIAAPSAAGTSGSWTFSDEASSRHRGRRSVIRALVDAHQRAARSGRRPLPVTPVSTAGEGPPAALFSKGPPASLLVRLDRAALRRWVRLDDDRVRLTVAPGGPVMPEVTAVLQLPDGTFLQFRATLLRARDDALTYESEPLSWGSLLPIRELRQPAR